MPENSTSSQTAIDSNYLAQADRGGTAIVNIYENVRPSPVDEKTLAKAEHILSSLPLDTIPDPAPFPPGSRMVYSRNPFFVGRQEDLKSLAQTLKAGGTAAIGQTTAVTGLGGIGKTQLACEFAHRYGQFFAGGVFWLSFSDPNSIPAEVALCGGPGVLDLRPDFVALPLPDQVNLVLSAWQSPFPRLLVFDNCEEESILDKWRPPSGGCRVLVTCRRATWNPALAVQPLPLWLLARQESIALLREHRLDLTVVEADAIAKELDDLPLALTLAGSFLYHYRNAVTPSAYLSQLRDKSLLDHPSLQGRGTDWSPTGHELHVGRTFALSYDKLDPKDPLDTLALVLLAQAACLAPGEPIPRDLLIATVNLPGNDPDALLLAEDALARLAGLGLMNDEGGSLSIHRLLQLFVRKLNPDQQAGEAVAEILLNEANHLNNAGDPRPLVAWQTHLRFVADQSVQRQDERSAGLCNALGYHLQSISDYTGASPYYELGLAIRRKVLGKEHPDTATSLNNLGYLLVFRGDYSEARPYYEQALAIRRKVLGEEHPDTAQTLNNLGYLLQAKGDFPGARPYYEQALAIRRKVLGKEHPDTATSLNNLGCLLQAMGDYPRAQSYYEQTLVICRKVLGEEHPYTASSLNNLGILLRAMGDLPAAQPYCEQALSVRRKVLGEEHPDTAQSLNNLGYLLQTKGDFTGARPYFEQALVIRRKVLGEEHPDTATSLNNLGGLLYCMGDYSSARSYFDQALAIRRKVLGEEHPDTAISIWWIGVLFQKSDDIDGARYQFQQAIRIFTSSFGSTHPTTQQCQKMLDELKNTSK